MKKKYAIRAITKGDKFGQNEIVLARCDDAPEMSLFKVIDEVNTCKFVFDYANNTAVNTGSIVTIYVYEEDK